MLNTQALYALQKSLSANETADRSKPHFGIAVRSDGPWVGMATMNDFPSFAAAASKVMARPDLKGCFVLVERLEQDKDDDTVYHSVVLHEGVL